MVFTVHVGTVTGGHTGGDTIDGNFRPFHIWSCSWKGIVGRKLKGLV